MYFTEEISRAWYFWLQIKHYDDELAAHSQRVADLVERYLPRSDYYYVVALLHDGVEDAYLTFDQISVYFKENTGFYKALQAITRQEGEPYMDYIKRCAAHPIAREVKRMDIYDHLMQYKTIPSESYKKRCYKALEILEDNA